MPARVTVQGEIAELTCRYACHPVFVALYEAPQHRKSRRLRDGFCDAPVIMYAGCGIFGALIAHANARLRGRCSRLGWCARDIDTIGLVTDDDDTPVAQTEDGVGVASRDGVNVGVFGWDHIDVVVVTAPTKHFAVILDHQRELIARAHLLDVDGRRRH